MKAYIKQLQLGVLVGLLLFSVGAVADEKKPPIKLTKAERTKEIRFHDKDRINLFISPLSLAKNPETQNTPWSQRERKSENLQIFCRKDDLEGSHGQTISYDLLREDPVENLVACGTSRFLAGEGATIAIYYVDLPNQIAVREESNTIKAARNEAKQAQQEAEESRRTLEQTTAIEEAQKKIMQGNSSHIPSQEYLKAKENTEHARKKALRDQGYAELKQIELGRLIRPPSKQDESESASSHHDQVKLCSDQRELPSIDDITETTRSTLLGTQLKQGAKFFSSNLEGFSLRTFSFKSILGETKSDSICAWKWKEYTLTKARAFVDASSPNPFEPDKTLDFDLITGSKENFFLSVDALFKDVKQLNAAAKSKDAVKEKPERVFLSLNYMLGDVYGTLPRYDTRRLVFKAMVTPNQQFESYGLGLGYRLASNPFSLSNKDSDGHSGLVIFVGRFWTRPAKSALDIPNTDARRVASTSLGVSYSLGAALDWLKPSK